MRKMRSIFIHTILCVIMLSFFSQAVCAQDLDREQTALNIIADFAQKICNDIPLKGISNATELSGGAKADLKGIVNKIANLGFKGAVKHSRSKYEGLLQADLAKALKDNTNCKLQIFNDLKDKLINKSKPVSKPEPSKRKNVLILNSYFSDLDCNKEYFSKDGVVKLEIKDDSLRGTTTVNDLMNYGTLNPPYTWKIDCYKRDYYLYCVYDTGVAILQHSNDDYVGYWIGENSENNLIKCPYVLSKVRLTEEQAKNRWDIFKQNCLLWDIRKDKFTNVQP